MFLLRKSAGAVAGRERERKKGIEASAAEGERHEGDRGLGGKVVGVKGKREKWRKGMERRAECVRVERGEARSEAERVRQRHNICALGETSGARVLHATASSCGEEETPGNGVGSVGGEVRAGGEGDVYAIKYKV